MSRLKVNRGDITWKLYRACRGTFCVKSTQFLNEGRGSTKKEWTDRELEMPLRGQTARRRSAANPPAAAAAVVPWDRRTDTASENVSVPGLVPWHYHRPPLHYSSVFSGSWNDFITRITLKIYDLLTDCGWKHQLLTIVTYEGKTQRIVQTEHLHCIVQ